ncbi:hypothetical protein Scep_018801 [Stephania cephalantha]|uniref:Uncharacterized protein n=1 Tax=Stephania cephalantha TaxID=152367 RepID=A0AAP0I9W3_9MAGN
MVLSLGALPLPILNKLSVTWKSKLAEIKLGVQSGVVFKKYMKRSSHGTWSGKPSEKDTLQLEYMLLSGRWGVVADGRRLNRDAGSRAELKPRIATIMQQKRQNFRNLRVNLSGEKRAVRAAVAGDVRVRRCGEA